MKTTYEHTFPFSKKFLLEQYSSKDFYEARIKIDGIQNSKLLNFKEKGAETTFQIDREVEIRTHSAPKFIQKIADKFVGDSALLSTQITWNKDKASGLNIIQAKGVPVSVTIKFLIKEISSDKAVIKSEMEINAKIPIVGKQLEKFMLPKAEKVMIKDFEKAEEYFQTL